MIITSKIKMDLALSGSTQRVCVVQDDKYSRNLEITLLCNGVPWEVPEGATGVVRYRKPDGTGGNYDLLPDGSDAVSIEGNVLTVALAPQVCTVPKVVKLAVGLLVTETVDDTAVTREVNTFSVDIDVQENPGLQVSSEGYYNVRGALPDSGWEPNMNLVTDENGKVVTRATPIGGLVLSGTMQPGQYLRVTGVDEDGNIVVEAVDIDVKAAVAYSYNGVELPELPDWDTDAYPYALIWLFTNAYGAWYQLELYSVEVVVYSSGNLTILPVAGSGYHMASSLSDGAWSELADRGDFTSILADVAKGTVWTNFDLRYKNTDDVYFSASDPVPVYE